MAAYASGPERSGDRPGRCIERGHTLADRVCCDGLILEGGGDLPRETSGLKFTGRKSGEVLRCRRLYSVVLRLCLKGLSLKRGRNRGSSRGLSKAKSSRPFPGFTVLWEKKVAASSNIDLHRPAHQEAAHSVRSLFFRGPGMENRS